VNNHNRSRSLQDCIIPGKLHSLYQNVIILDSDSKFIERINASKPPRYNIVKVENNTMTHLHLLESLYNGFLNNEQQDRDAQIKQIIEILKYLTYR
jgi:hypothetical protein